jgi:hypothetical protein
VSRSSKLANSKLTPERSDAAVKQIILTMNERTPIIVQDLDDTHILIRPESLEELKEQLEVQVRPTAMVSLVLTLAQLEKNTYTLE